MIISLLEMEASDSINKLRFSRISEYIGNLNIERIRLNNTLLQNSNENPLFFDENYQKTQFELIFKNELEVPKPQYFTRKFSFSGFLDDMIYFIKKELLIFNEENYNEKEVMIKHSDSLLYTITRTLEIFQEDCPIILNLCSVLISAFIKKDLFKYDAQYFSDFYMSLGNNIFKILNNNWNEEMAFQEYNSTITFLNPINVKNADSIIFTRTIEAKTYFKNHKERLLKVETIMELNPSCYKSENLKEFLKRIGYDYETFKNTLQSIVDSFLISNYFDSIDNESTKYKYDYKKHIMTLMQSLDEILIFVKLPQGYGGLTSLYNKILITNFTNEDQNKWGNLFIAAWTLIIILHEINHYVLRLANPQDLLIDSPRGEGGNAFENSFFGRKLKTLSEEQAQFILEKINWSKYQNVVDFKTDFEKIIIKKEGKKATLMRDQKFFPFKCAFSHDNSEDQ